MVSVHLHVQIEIEHSLHTIAVSRPNVPFYMLYINNFEKTNTSFSKCKENDEIIILKSKPKTNMHIAYNG